MSQKTPSLFLGFLSRHLYCCCGISQLHIFRTWRAFVKTIAMMLSQLTQTSARCVSTNAGCITVQGSSIFQTNYNPGCRARLPRKRTPFDTAVGDVRHAKSIQLTEMAEVDVAIMAVRILQRMGQRWRADG